MMTNVYYSDKIAHQVFEEDRVYDTGEPVSEHIGYTDLYIRTIANTPSLFDKPFWASDNFVFDDVLKWQTEIGSLSEEQKKERAAVVVGLHRDPYEDEKIEDRPQMYKDTLTMMTADVAENLPKARAIVEIIKAYSRVDRINKTLNELQATGQSMVDNEKSIKMLVEQKSKEMATISSLCKEYNLSDASSGGKGFGSISSIVRDMDDKSYDIGFVNRFDIETTQAMQQVADISMNAIFKQLKFSTADFAQIVQEQAQMIKTMQNTLAAQAEELRLLKAEHIKQELLEEYKLILQERKIDPKEIERVVAEQINWGVYGDKRIYDDITEGYQ